MVQLKMAWVALKILEGYPVCSVLLICQRCGFLPDSFEPVDRYQLVFMTRFLKTLWGASS